MNRLINLISNSDSVLDIDKKQSFNANSLQSAGLSIVTSYLKNKRNINIIVPSLFDGQNLYNFISSFVNKEEILFYSFDEILRIDKIYSSKELSKERIKTLFELSVNTNKTHILIINSVALTHYVCKKEIFKSNCLSISKGMILPPKYICNRLIELGYTKVNKVESTFEFSIRGEILDIFTPSNDNPIRIEYFDDVIDDIREFNVDSELSFNQILNKIFIVPAIEYIFTKEEVEKGIENIEKELKTYKNTYENNDLIVKARLFIENLHSFGFNDAKESFIPYFTNDFSTILDYIDTTNTYIYRYDDSLNYVSSYIKEARDYENELKSNLLLLNKEQICFNFNENIFNKCILIKDENSELDLTSIPYHFSNVNSCLDMIDQIKSDGYKVYIVLNKNDYASFKNLCEKNNRKLDLTLSNNGYNLIVFNGLPNGFILSKYNIAVITSKEIYGVIDASLFFLRRFKEGKVINKYSDLDVGDYVVHQQFGISKYLGIKKIDGLEYLTLKFNGEGEILYVPLNQFYMIRKYSSKEGVVPTLDNLGGASWAKRKAKIRGRITYLADKLLEIEAKRLSSQGFAFEKDSELEEEFSQKFMYKLTPSQEKAWNEISADMTSCHVMDRLLTGDVGFGKTEIAFKAIFKCVLSGKQAAFLCPTTVLANQHYQVAIDRFNGFGLHIALFNRNISKKEEVIILNQLEQGEIDLIIGTHKLLSNNVKFKNLGLLVVDEEQRFGVTHKEKIKSITNNIDVLTLTATPIPRTLQMSLLNVRSLSLLDTPPSNRMPVKTYVVRFDWDLVKEVIARELSRKGQVYFLHNRIDTIYKVVDKLHDLFPSNTIKVVHGQESGKIINKVMDEFYLGRIDILVCTSIIETGLDVPNCNTIIVQDAQNFGLAQLYQIQGRVGRSASLGYAYLTYPDYKKLSDDSQKRLKALKNFTELGSGYKIATEDLNIRGAGDILGKEQAGFIDSLGYDAYMQLLDEVIKEKKVIYAASLDNERKLKFEINFSVDACIPTDYAPEHDRINIYRELFDIEDINTLHEFKKKVIDVYGHLPLEVENLFIKKEDEILLSTNLIFAEFNEMIDKFEIVLSREFSNRDKISYKLEKIIDLVDKQIYSIRYYNGAFRIFIHRRTNYLLDIYDIVMTLIKFDQEEENH